MCVCPYFDLILLLWLLSCRLIRGWFRASASDEVEVSLFGCSLWRDYIYCGSTTFTEYISILSFFNQGLDSRYHASTRSLNTKVGPTAGYGQSNKRLRRTLEVSEFSDGDGINNSRPLADTPALTPPPGEYYDEGVASNESEVGGVHASNAKSIVAGGW